MWKVFVAGIFLACVLTIATFALHLLNQSSDVAVAFGYLILLAIFAAAVGLIQRFRRNW
jgi:hypothetical protein